MTTKLPARWQQELDVQSALRRRVHHIEQQAKATLDAIAHVLQTGGRGWVNELGRLRLREQEEWYALVSAVSTLNQRRSSV